MQCAEMEGNGLRPPLWLPKSPTTWWCVAACQRFQAQIHKMLHDDSPNTINALAAVAQVKLAKTMKEQMDYGKQVRRGWMILLALGLMLYTDAQCRSWHI